MVKCYVIKSLFHKGAIVFPLSKNSLSIMQKTIIHYDVSYQFIDATRQYIIYTVFLLVNRLFFYYTIFNLYSCQLVTLHFIIVFTSACCILSGKKVSQNNFPFFQRYLVFDLFCLFYFIFIFFLFLLSTHILLRILRS